jgi:hypothetical protein
MTTTRSFRNGPTVVDLPDLSPSWSLAPPPPATTTTTLAPPLSERESRELDLQAAWHTLREHTPELRHELDVAVALGVAAARREIDRWARRTVRERAFALVGLALAVGVIAGLRPR